MNAMRKNMWTTGALALLVGAGVANAGTTFPYDPDGLGPLTASAPAPAIPPNLLGGLDWSVGNSLAQFDAGTNLHTRPLVNGSQLRVGDKLTTYYQSKLTRFQDNSPSGTSTLFTGPGPTLGLVNGLGTFANDFEWTVIARFREVVTNIQPSGEADFAVIDDLPLRPNYFRVFYDGASNVANGGGPNTFGNSNELAGTGYADGVLILEARGGSGTGDFRPDGTVADFDQFLGASSPWDGGTPGNPLDNYRTVQGSGDFVADADITFFNPNFFNFPALAAGTFRIVEHDTDQELPFDSTNPAIQFRDDATFINSQFAGGPNEYTLATVNGLPQGTFYDAVQFEADADSSFDIEADIPEPATATLGLMGVFGLLMGRRARKA